KEEKNIELYDSFEHNNNYSRNIVEDAYSNEIVAFFNQVQNGIKPIYDFNKDQKVLDVMDRMEENL
ncbi:MAG: gfo/Idh/MocA family oxidoreductase, partial [Lachnospiraceae bacterium]|nr:gfo/Idh/MocA family oxidoreductase [Lachnospiraceae bacterium]